MLLTLTTTHRPATDLGFLLHKNPSRVQSFDLSFGRAHVFYPEAGRFRHADHRFEWGRAEFRAWADGVAVRFGYAVRYRGVGDEDALVGPPTQMAVFERMSVGPR